jgi:hypothetical protein
MAMHYDHRSIMASEIVVSADQAKTYNLVMIDKRAFLEKVLANAGTKAEMARALNLPTPRIAEIFNGTRKLSFEEGMTLAEKFDVAPFDPVNAERLFPILRACLAAHTGLRLSDDDLANLSSDVEYGLTLLRSARTNQPSQDAIDLVSRVLTDRHLHKRD